MKQLTLNAFFFLAFAFTMFSQQNDVLFSVNDKPIYTKEFERVYNKNLDLVQDESQKNVEGYLDLFINYKLKLEEAYSLGLDEKPAYKRELEGYERQLIDKYINDNEVTDQLVMESYERLKKEINADHILVKIDQNASPEQERLALEEIKKLGARVLQEGYEAVQKDVHNGATIFAENLGYFTAFKMVYEFENAAYETKVGEISEPFRTQFGYHIVKVNDVRDNRGEITVAHIMVPGQDKALIDQIYKRLEQNEEFESLAKQYSIDKSSANRGGVLPPFTGGQLSSSEFEEASFALNTIGAYTKPFKTEFGWHISKLIAKNKLDTFENEKFGLESKVRKDSRSRILNDKRIEKLMKIYNVSYNNSKLKTFEKALNDDYFKGLWSAPENIKTNETLVLIKNKALTFNDFANFLTNSQRKIQSKKPFNLLVSQLYKDFIDRNLSLYQEENLANENEEFAAIFNEYKEGLLLFDLMGSEIWNAATNDSLALKNYFETHKNNYKFKTRIVATISSSAKKDIAKKVAKDLKNEIAQDQLANKYNTSEINVTINSGTYELEDPALPSDLKLKKGVSKVYFHNNAYLVIDVKEILPAGQKTFEEAKGSVISDFQDEKEVNWVKSLREKYKVTINESELNQLKNKYN
ncbi:peptidylprolyl isomerase [Aurantibacter aestuarii]|uniref:Peptidylprolyl isomerase n=1 Tax=Aurantibacter aestuarii TaxID=1266046 RepID=A0A2T1N828_9FLAO|nr:peptidylprolyl isomerase [Aurantibacter aestuarii]PSG88018.1 peptidylprolyl isomerase [Aurantibacter aestuarii]